MVELPYEEESSKATPCLHINSDHWCTVALRHHQPPVSISTLKCHLSITTECDTLQNLNLL